MGRYATVVMLWGWILLPGHAFAQLLTNNGAQVVLTTGALVTINGDVQNQASGTLELQDASTLEISGDATILSGSVQLSGTALMRVTGNMSVSAGATVDRGGTGTLEVQGTFSNAGAVTNPAVNFLGTTDNQPVVFRANNVERMRITPTGAVSITGIQYPRLLIETNSTTAGDAYIDLAGYRSTNTTVGSILARNRIIGDPNNDIVTEVDFLRDGNNDAGAIAFQTRPTGGSLTERMRITSTGDVGIGTNAPTHRLEVRNGNLALTNSDNTARQIRFYEPSTSGSNYTAFQAQAQTNDITYTLPSSLPTTNGFLRSDNSGNLSWAATTASSIYIRKTADESVTSSTTLQDDDHLVYSASANTVFEFECYMFISGGNGGIKIRINIPTGATMKLYGELKKNDQHHWTYAKLTSSSDEISWDPVVNNYGYARIRGIISIGSTAGNVQVRWAQNSSNSTATTVEANSYLKITPVQ